MNAKHQLCHLDGTNGKGVCALAWKELLMELGVGALLRNCFLSMMAGSVHSGGAHVDRQPPLHSKDAVDFA